MTEKEPITGKAEFEEQKQMAGKMKSIEEKRQGLVTEKFTVGYGKKVILSDVNLMAEPGKVLTLIGPNGSGKSTILKSIVKQLKTLGGVVYLNGKATSEMKEPEIAKSLSMVMTEHIHPELMSCRDVVATGRYPYTGRLGILDKQDWKLVDEAIAMVHAEEVAEQPFTRISDGQRQRVMLARAICQDTAILVLDEPTSYLDIRYKLDILNSIRKLARERNIAVIMSLHELDLVQKVSDMVACVDGTTVSRIGTPEEIFPQGVKDGMAASEVMALFFKEQKMNFMNIRTIKANGILNLFPKLLSLH